MMWQKGKGVDEGMEQREGGRGRERRMKGQMGRERDE